MQMLKTGLVLILAILLNTACTPEAAKLQAMPASVVTMDNPVQTSPATLTLTPTPSQAEASSPIVRSPGAMDIHSGSASESDLDINPESSFPLAPGTQWDPGNGGSEEAESGGAFLLHSKAPIETVEQFYQSALPSQGWSLRYYEANHGGGLTQYWKMDMVYMSVDFAYDPSGLAIQVQWHQVDAEYMDLFPKGFPLPEQAELVDATDTTWEVYIPLQIEAATEYYRQMATTLNWEPGKAPAWTGASCVGDCANQAAPIYAAGVTPMPTATPDTRQPQTLMYTMTDGNEISLEFQPHQDSTILNMTLTMKNVESAGLPKEVPIFPEATGMVIAPGMVRFTVSMDLEATVQIYVKALTGAGWVPYAGYGLDTPDLYFQEWVRGEESLRLNISTPGSPAQTSVVSIQCMLCKSP